LLNTGITTHIYSFDFWNSNIGYAGGQGAFIKTINGGISWEILSKAPFEIYSITCIDSKFIFASGRGKYSGDEFGFNYGAISYSTNGGSNWTIMDTLTKITSIIYSSFPSNKLGYFVGEGYRILRLNISNTTGIPADITIKTHNIFPNPTSCIINFYLPEVDNGFNFQLYDIHGKLLTNEFISSRNYDMVKYRKGIYYYQIITDKDIYNGKIIKE
jgi:hypothetical protein